MYYLAYYRTNPFDELIVSDTSEYGVYITTSGVRVTDSDIRIERPMNLPNNAPNPDEEGFEVFRQRRVR